MHTDTTSILETAPSTWSRKAPRRWRLCGGWRLPEERDCHRESFDVIVIGGGQAGLAVGFHLAQPASAS